MADQENGLESDDNTGNDENYGDKDRFAVSDYTTNQPIVQSIEAAVPADLQKNMRREFDQSVPQHHVGEQKQPLMVRVVKDDDLSSFERKTVRAARYGVIVASLSLLAAIAAAIFVYSQFGEMKKQTKLLAASLEKQRQDSLDSNINTTKQLGILSAQLTEQRKGTLAITNQMRQDQRPWLRVEFVPSPGVGADPTKPQSTTTVVSGQPITVPIRVRNTGKTPAQDIRADFLIAIAAINDVLPFPIEAGVRQRVQKDRPKSAGPASPPIRIRTVGNHMETGAIFPDSFTEASLVEASLENGKEVTPPLTVQQLLDVIGGKRMIYVIGRIEYFDEFGSFHWTDFCRPLSDASGSRVCAKYNAVDSNQ